MTDVKTIAESYLQAASTKDLTRLSQLLAPDLQFTSPATTLDSAAGFVTAFKRLAAIHVRNDARRIFIDGNEACVIYDFVTDTSVGIVPTVEWLRIEDGRIRSIRLFYDRLPWQTVLAELSRRTAA